MIGKIILAITGIGAGFIISAGVFALITSTGIITRFADKTHTAKSIQLYETIVIAGGILWNIFWIMESHFKFTGQPAKIFQGIMGLCQGIFVGYLAVALAEALNGTAIFARRAKTANGAKFHSVISSGRQSPCIVAPILQRLGELMLLNMLLCRKIISRKIQPLVSKLSTSVFRPKYASLVGTRKYII